MLHHQTHKAGSFEKADLICYTIGIGHYTYEVSVYSRKLNICFQKVSYIFENEIEIAQYFDVGDHFIQTN